MVVECAYKHLEKLNISHRRLVVPSLTTLTKLKNMFLNGNCLLFPPNQLEELVLDGNQLTMLPSAIGSLRNLTILGVNCNPISSRGLGRPDRAAGAVAAYCGLMMLPSSIGRLNKLQKPGLNNNTITALPPDLGQLQALHWLNLAGNEFKALPDEINNLVLDLDRNSFEHVPKSLSDMTSLQVMSMKFNDITSLEDDLILGFTGMTKLELRENPLRHKPHHWNVTSKRPVQISY